jgi:glutaredoxin
VRYVLVTRVGCHLCEEAAAALRDLGVEFGEADVDADAELQRLYDFRVPVLLGAGKVVAEGKLDRQRLSTALRR